MCVFEELIKELSRHVCLDGSLIIRDEIFHESGLLVIPETDPAILNARIWSPVRVLFDVDEDSTWGMNTHPYLEATTYDTKTRILVRIENIQVSKERVEQELMMLRLRGDFYANA